MVPPQSDATELLVSRRHWKFACMPFRGNGMSPPCPAQMGASSFRGGPPQTGVPYGSGSKKVLKIERTLANGNMDEETCGPDPGALILTHRWFPLILVEKAMFQMVKMYLLRSPVKTPAKTWAPTQRNDKWVPPRGRRHPPSAIRPRPVGAPAAPRPRKPTALSPSSL